MAKIGVYNVPSPRYASTTSYADYIYYINREKIDRAIEEGTAEGLEYSEGLSNQKKFIEKFQTRLNQLNEYMGVPKTKAERDKREYLTMQSVLNSQYFTKEDVRGVENAFNAFAKESGSKQGRDKYGRFTKKEKADTGAYDRFKADTGFTNVANEISKGTIQYIGDDRYIFTDSKGIAWVIDFDNSPVQIIYYKVGGVLDYTRTDEILGRTEEEIAQRRMEKDKRLAERRRKKGKVSSEYKTRAIHKRKYK